jgi:hypothetical protein
MSYRIHLRNYIMLIVVAEIIQHIMQVWIYFMFMYINYLTRRDRVKNKLMSANINSIAITYNTYAGRDKGRKKVARLYCILSNLLKNFWW